MFKIDDYIVYGGNGVCKVVDVGIPEISSFKKETEYYTLKPVYENATIYTPINNTKVVMREVISKDEADELINKIPSIQTGWIPDSKVREGKYKEIIHHFDCEGLVKIIKTILSKKEEFIESGKKLSTIDIRYLKEAQDYLFGELAVAFNIPKDDVPVYIQNSIKSKSMN